MNWRYIIISYLGLFSFGLIDNARGPVYPEILKFFGIPTTLGSAMFALSSFSGLLVTIFGRWWLTWYGPYKSLRIFILLLGLGSIGIGLSGFLPQGYYWLLFSSLCFGAGAGGVGITSNILVGQGSLVIHRRKAYSGLHAMYGIASLLAPVFIGMGIRLGFDWRISFLALSAVPFSIFLFGHFNRKSFISGDILSYHSKVPLKVRLLIASIFGFYVASEIAVSSRLVYFANTVWQWDTETSAIYLSLFFSLLLIGRLSFALFTFPGSSYYWPVYSVIASMICYLLGLYVHPIGLSLCGLTMSIFFPCAMDWINEKFGRHSDSMMPIIMTSMAMMLVVMHLVIGQLASRIGILQAMLIGPLFLIIVLILLFFAKKTTPPVCNKG